MGHLEQACVQLLACCEVSDKNEPILGDLLEERHGGRSRLWFVREVLFLLIMGVGRQIASDKLLTLGSILMGLAISIPLRTLLRRLEAVIGGGGLEDFVITSAAFALTGIAIRYKFQRHSVAMAAAFTAYALFSKVSLVLMNFDRFQSASHPAHLPLAIAAVTLPPMFAVSGALASRWMPAKCEQT